MLSAGWQPGLLRARKFSGRLELGFKMRPFQLDGRQTRFRKRVGRLGAEESQYTCRLSLGIGCRKNTNKLSILGVPMKVAAGLTPDGSLESHNCKGNRGTTPAACASQKTGYCYADGAV